MYSSSRISIALLGLVAVSAGACRSAGGCGGSVKTAASSTPDAGGGDEAFLATIAAGPGVIRGEVMLSGAPPPMRPLKRGTDPVCAKGATMDEQVLVKDGKLQNVVVRILGTANSPPPSSPTVLDQEGCTFRPRVQGAIVGQRVEIRNSDGILHNIHAYREGKTLFNYAQPAQSSPRVFTASASGAIKLRCDVHPWMTAVIVVSPSSYFAVTGPEGAFSIAGVADATYELEAWHERYGLKRSTIVLRDGVTSKVAFTYSPDDRG